MWKKIGEHVVVKTAFAMLSAGLLFGAAGCGTIDEAFDCQAVCDKYKDCLDNSYDVGACRTRCRDKAAADSEYKRKADTCHACISDRSCKDSTIKCITECASIVP